MKPSPHKPTLTQADVDSALGALRLLSDKAERAMCAALLIEANIAIACLSEAAEFDGVAE